jgi:Fur family transcriptional regulator, ferric uptake regulator
MSADADLDAKGMLEHAKLYCTKARIAILSVLLKGRGPMRQDQIAEQLAPAETNKVTIYRTLESLVKAGLVHRVFMNDRVWHFEPAHHCTEAQCHPHFTCRNCGATHCMPGIRLPMAQSPYEGFIISHQEVRLEGLCPACA